ncbi:RHS repeat-associated core domain-containing protein [Fulvivirga sediminis]|uniref:RHS repeat-associated core domain-containing protein n=1 Tax=Fulvivirga sediminis TaxID=2803949 RepID=A0A937F2N0_9BACT|nr:RHS repeat-associated core domain-containing protein [Fulvivirga sediminis]MBL3655187.1 RHS repeat-associated core domain-containing protein [Fulvivirga sediminis]
MLKITLARGSAASRPEKNDNFDKMKVHDFTVPANGYIMVYLNNEGANLTEAYFDDMQLTLEESPIIQVDDYYPFGLAFNSYQRTSAQPNKYLYNGKERITDLDLGWDDYGARMYMSDIGRWGVIDPIADKRDWLTPYNYVQNNPLIRIDPTGMLDEYGLDTETGSLTFIRETEGDDVIYTGTYENGEFIKDGGSKTFTKGSSNIKEITTERMDDGTVFDAGDAQYEGLIFKEGYLQEGLAVMEFISFKTEIELNAWGYESKDGQGLYIEKCHENDFAKSKEYLDLDSYYVPDLGKKIGNVHTHPSTRKGYGIANDNDIEIRNTGVSKEFKHFINSRNNGWVEY